MSTMANTTPIVTTVTETTTKEKTPNEAETASRINLDFCEEHYDDILSVMDKICRDKRREVHTRLDFRENSKKSRIREDSQNSSAKTLSARYRNSPERPQIRDRLRNNDGNMFGRLSHRKESAFKRLRDTYSPSTTNSRDDSHSRGRPHKRNSSSRDRLRNRDRSRNIEESYAESSPSEGGHWKSKSKRILIKRLNEHVPKTLEEMMTATTAFIRGEAAAASKKKVYTPWKSQDQPKRTPKEIFAAGSGKFKPPPPMVTPVDKRSSNKLCEFHNDKGHNTDECVQLRKQIKELVRAGKLSHFTKEIRRDRDQQKTRQKDAPVKDKAAAIYMIQPWQRVTGRRALYKSMYEFYDSEVTITVQRHHRKAWDKRNPSSTIHGSQNAQILTTPKDHAKKSEIRHDNFKVAIHPEFLDQEITIGGTVSIKARTKLCTLLKRNLDIFAWQPSDMTGVPRSIAEHRLNIRKGYSPVRQKKRGQAPERAKAIQVEVQKLVEAGILREVYYHDWLSNPVMVKKHDGSWRMCVDFTNLNKACLQDCYPLSEIDWKVESLCGYSFKCFLDAYKGYHQIQMAEQDEEKTAFHTSHGVYCYTKMPFSLKKAGATYQRLVDKAFDKQIGRNLEIYVDDLVIKRHINIAATRYRRDVPHCGFNDRKRHSPNTGLFCELSTAYSRAKLYPNRKASPCASLRSQEAAQILPGASHRGHHRPAHQASDVTSQRDFLVEKPDDAPPEASVIETPQEPWTLFTDGSSCVDGSGARLILTSPEGTEFTYALSVDSKVVANQVLGTYVAKEENMVKYLAKAKSLISSFANFSVLVEVLKEISIQEEEVATVVEEEGPTWMTPIMKCLKDGALPGDRKEASKLRIKARQYELWEGVLYRRSFLKPWLRCFRPLQADYVIQKIHEGSYIDPFPKGPGKVKFLIVAMDYFTKWIEAKAVATITSGQVKKFVWDNIVCRFGLPREIVSDNVDAVHNNEELRLNLDLLEERRECAAIREAKAKLKMTKYYNSWVHGVTFRPGDIFYRSNEASHAMDGGNLGPKWEGPYEVTEALEDGAYRLMSMDGAVLSRTWNVANLKKCYL
uniref:Reverse transcriptase domain-containing protein n=1 Tax=Tanacetum cinerariifolium TaxID=118510 RepID=A0A6L2KT70_TANCI|nr:reverse transcriptase domain-containing protein [Tanacetum cinerariifolium]